MARKISRDILEILVGAFALMSFAVFVAFALTVNQKAVTGYQLSATYNHIDGLAMGANVRLAGIPVGEVVSERFDPTHDQAHVTMTITDGVAIPRDSAAIIASDGLFGGKFIKIDPGGDTKMLEPGDSFNYVQDSIDLERLLARVVQEAETRRNAARAGSTDKGG